MLGTYNRNLSSSLLGKATAPVSEISTIELRKERQRKLSSQINQGYAMSSSQKLKQHINKSINLNNLFYPISYDCTILADICASKIQRLVKNRDVRRS